MMNSEMAQYLGVFLDEAQEQLELFETHVLELERSENPDSELQVLFRNAHTLKGSSKAMGFIAIGDLTHEMENVLDALRSHEMELSSSVIDVLLQCLDMLKSLIAEVAANGSEGEVDSVKFDSLVSTLDRLRTGRVQATQPAEVSAVAPLATTAGLSISITIADDCPMKGIRAALILGSLGSLGAVVSTIPPAKDLEDERFENSFVVELSTERSAKEVDAFVANLLDVTSVSVETSLDESAKPAAVEPAPVVIESAPVDTTINQAATPSTQSTSSTVRVDIARLDKLLNLVGELVTDRTQLVTMATALHEQFSNNEQMAEMLEGINRFGRVTSELQEEVMKSRMLPINGVFQRMPRMVRDLAQKTDKELDLEISGGETELDRSVLEILGDPLIHLLRNAVEHGLETPDERIAAGKPARGLVELSARHERSQIVIEIVDNGRGIDPSGLKASAVRKGLISEATAEAMTDREAIQLIFAPGFTTAKQLSDISGRGVGMDIVRSNIERIGGRILIDSEVGRGSRFLIYLPLTLAIVRAVLVTAEHQVYAIPLTSVTEMVTLKHASGGIQQCSAGGQSALMLRGKTLPLACLADVMGGNQRATEPGRVKANSYAVVVRHGDGEAALSVDSLNGEMEVVIKPLGSLLKDIPGVSGASILGDGRVALVVDPSKALEDLNRTQLAA